MTPISNPFDLDAAAAYARWRERKLAAYPADTDLLRVEVARLAEPSQAERRAILHRVARWSMALVAARPEDVEPETAVAFGRALGLTTTDANLFADARAVSAIAPSAESGGDGGAAEAGDARGEFIPYTTKPMGWHTDGYYNAPEAQVGAWTLFCRRAAPSGGANRLLDHEIAYILLRDASPEHIRALSHPQALVIPAHVRDGRVLRPASAGPVFSVRDGRLHMRYSARTRNAEWRETPATRAARAALDRLFSEGEDFTFAHSLQPGEGLVSNNVLHCRTGFADESDESRRRLLYRVRYREAIDTAELA